MLKFLFSILIFISLFIFMACNSGGGGSSDPTPVTTDATTIASGSYSVGYTISSTGVSRAAYWYNGTRTDLPSIDATRACEAKSIGASGTHLYISGVCNDGTGAKYGYWDNGVWNYYDVTSGYNYQTYPSMAILNGTMYVPGYRYQSSPSQSIPGYFMNKTWVDLPQLDASKESGAVRVSRVNNDIYISGYSKNSANVTVAGYWKNGIWNEVYVPPAASTYIVQLTGVAFADNAFYAVGIYQESFSSNREAQLWKNGVKSILPVRNGSTGCGAADVETKNGDVYVAGTCEPWSTPVPGYWKNSVWNELPILSAGKLVSISSMSILNDGKVFICGYAYDADNKYKAVYWQDGAIHRLSTLDATQQSWCMHTININ